MIIPTRWRRGVSKIYCRRARFVDLRDMFVLIGLLSACFHNDRRDEVHQGHGDGSSVHVVQEDLQRCSIDLEAELGGGASGEGARLRLSELSLATCLTTLWQIVEGSFSAVSKEGWNLD